SDDSLGRRCESGGHIGRRERAMRAGISSDQRLERMWHGLGECQRQAERNVAPERVAISGSVLGGDQPGLAAELNLDRTAGTREFVDPFASSALASQIDLCNSEITDLAKHIV